MRDNHIPYKYTLVVIQRSHRRARGRLYDTYDMDDYGTCVVPCRRVLNTQCIDNFTEVQTVGARATGLARASQG